MLQFKNLKTVASLLAITTVVGCSDDDGTNDGMGGDAGQTGGSGGTGIGGDDGAGGSTGGGDAGGSGGDGSGGDGSGGDATGGTSQGNDSWMPVETPAAPSADGTPLEATPLGRFDDYLVFDESAAEIVDFAHVASVAFVTNGDQDQIDAFEIDDEGAIGDFWIVDVEGDINGDVGASSFGGINSLAIFDDGVAGDPAYMAVAVENDSGMSTGWVAMYSIADDGETDYLEAVPAGALPDMVTFTPDGAMVLVANEGEPADDLSVDPEGTITVFDWDGAASSVTQLDFQAWNGDKEAMIAAGVRFTNVQGDASAESPTLTASTVAEDLEPEYITVTPDGRTAYVTLQENNALAVVDLTTDGSTVGTAANAKLDSYVALGFQDHNVVPYDPSNDDGAIQFVNADILGNFMPDALEAFEVGGTTYLATANEGDGREYGIDDGELEKLMLLDEIDFADLATVYEQPGTATLAIPDYDENAVDERLGSLAVSTVPTVYDTTTCELTKVHIGGGFPDDEDFTGSSVAVLASKDGQDCVVDQAYGFGARSFTIWNADGSMAFDSGSDLEALIAELIPWNFNATDGENELDDRSDNKGPEPESIEFGVIDSVPYLFVGLERIGGIAVFDMTEPTAPAFVTYLDTRNHTPDRDLEVFLDTAGDLAPEGLKFVPTSDSPTGSALLLAAYEVSGTTRVWQLEPDS